MPSKLIITYTAKTDGSGFHFSNTQMLSLPEGDSIEGVRIVQNGVEFTIGMTPSSYSVVLLGSEKGNPNNDLVIGEVSVMYKPEAGKFWTRKAYGSVLPGEVVRIDGTVDLSICRPLPK